jgi:hypothetical protein
MTSSLRQTQTPLLERRAAEITRLLAEVSTLKKRVTELEAELAAAKKK